jgi:hypothetical protein
MIYDPATHGPLLPPEEAREELWQTYRLPTGLHHLARLRSKSNKGGPPYIKIGGKVRYPRVPLHEWACQQVSRPLLAATGQPAEAA